MTVAMTVAITVKAQSADDERQRKYQSGSKDAESSNLHPPNAPQLPQPILIPQLRFQSA